MAAKQNKSNNLKYGEGQREEYGEGYGYTQEETSEAADKMNQSGVAGGGHKSSDRRRSQARQDKMKKQPEKSGETQTPPADGAGFRRAKGGLPEKQPVDPKAGSDKTVDAQNPKRHKTGSGS